MRERERLNVRTRETDRKRKRERERDKEKISIGKMHSRRHFAFTFRIEVGESMLNVFCSRAFTGPAVVGLFPKVHSFMPTKYMK